MEHEFERQLRTLAIERRPEACLGCGFEHGCSVHGCAVIHAAVNRLAAYEETRLEPEDMKKAFNEDTTLKLAGQILGVTPGRLRELAQAEKEGQLAVLQNVKYTDSDGEKALRHAMYMCGVQNNPVTRYTADAIAEKLTREAAEAALEEMEAEHE
ncbi:hypothetical protein [Ruthenibacterium lactatiformans]|uniref:hypothetical protein n=1 Tax=Ruthenibacterium lactatiformans TaxID=1550024 RepID=UPI002675E827|nr:hypothetical protein [Ruthenibacterium lactatiformans]